MKAKPSKQYMTTRVQYKKAKKYDHGQFDLFCSKIYEEGFNDGAASVSSVGLKDVISAIQTVKGIGEKRLELIKAAAEVLFNKEIENYERVQKL